MLPTGLEPVVSPLSGVCFNQLSYGSKDCPCKQKSYLFTCPSRAVRSFRSRISLRLLNRHRSFKLCHTVFSFQLRGWSNKILHIFPFIPIGTFSFSTTNFCNMPAMLFFQKKISLSNRRKYFNRLLSFFI